MADITTILQQYKDGSLTLDAAQQQLQTAVSLADAASVEDMGFANIDLQRKERCGFPEVVYCAGKTIDQSVQILTLLMQQYDNVIGMRADKAVYDRLVPQFPDVQYQELARMVKQSKVTHNDNGERNTDVGT